MAESETVVEARGLTRRYGDLVAVDGIDFAVRRGECFGLLGPNGAGKTSTMRMIYRALPLSSGSLRVLGLEVGPRNDRAIKRRIGVVPQEENLDWDLSVRENLTVFGRFYGLHGAAAQARVDELLGFLKLEAKADSKIRALSGGLRRRVLIARGLLGEPDIVVLDEPTTGLDPQARHDLWERLNALKRRAATLLLTTHYMDEAERLCDRLLIVDRGKIVSAGAPRDLIAQHVPAHVVEIRLDGDGTVPPEAESLRAEASRSEVLSDRLLLYTERGEELIAHAARRLPERRALWRPATLEDVFIKITGRQLEG